MPLVGILVSGLMAIGGALLRTVAWAFLAEVLVWPFRWLWSRRQGLVRWFQGG